MTSQRDSKNSRKGLPFVPVALAAKPKAIDTRRMPVEFERERTSMCSERGQNTR